MLSLEVRTGSRAQMLDITGQVMRAVEESGVREGVCLVYVPHTTAGVTINENADPSVAADILASLEKLVPRDAGYRHREGNSDAHIKALMTGFSQAIPVRDGRLALGTWQGVFFCEYDGPRTRTVLVQVLSCSPYPS
jgi:secondary thiamine-phosphate synthase enzyme